MEVTNQVTDRSTKEISFSIETKLEAKASDLNRSSSYSVVKHA